jgi:hypothetical protein
MTSGEWIEVAAIGILAPISWLAWPFLPSPIPLWQMVLGLASLLLFQSLVRDFAIVLHARRLPSNESPKKPLVFVWNPRSA